MSGDSKASQDKAVSRSLSGTPGVRRGACRQRGQLTSALVIQWTADLPQEYSQGVRGKYSQVQGLHGRKG